MHDAKYVVYLIIFTEISRFLWLHYRDAVWIIHVIKDAVTARVKLQSNFKTILPRCDKKIYFSLFCHHQIMKWPWLSPYFKPSVYNSCWLLCAQWTFSKLNISYSVLQQKVYRSPAKGKAFADSVSFHFHNIVLSLLNALSIYANNRKFVGQNVQRVHLWVNLAVLV